MGFDFNKFKASNAKAKENINAFHPIELTERNVEVIFNRCLKSDKTVKETRVEIAFREDAPILERNIEEGLYVFDEDTVTANQKSIKYLIGQLQAAHSSDDNFQLADLIMRYNHSAWTNSEKALQKLCYLGRLTHLLTRITIKGKDYTIRTNNYAITPTLSPRDPNFPAWWEAHKAEWES